MLHTTATGEMLMSRTLNCEHSQSVPFYSYNYERYNTPYVRGNQPDPRLVKYENMEKNRYRDLGLRRLPTCVNSVARVYNERYGESKEDIRASKGKFPHIVLTNPSIPTFHYISTTLPNPRNSMASQNFNKLNPFTTEKTRQEMRHLIHMIS